MNELVRLDNPNPENIFFGQKPRVTDWSEVCESIQFGLITVERMLAEIKAMEPLPEYDAREHDHRVLQQKLRLALLHKEGKLLVSKHTCEKCGKHLADHLVLHEEHSCLDCRTRERQLLNGGSRGGCRFVRPVYNPKSKHWGLLYYWSGNDRNRFLFFIADYYESLEKAENALLPVRLYFDWLNRKYNGMLSWMHFDDLVPVDEAMKLNLPLEPRQFEELLRQKIAADMQSDQPVLAHYVREAMRKQKDNERDD